MESFWITDRPTLTDVEEAFEIAKTGIAVSIRWYVKWNGSHERIITKETTEKYNCEQYFNECIPHVYGV